MSEPIATTQYRVVTKTAPTFYFIGVTTSKSSIMRVFPLWMRELDRPEIVIEGMDLQIHADPEDYRQAVAQIKYDPYSLGALVTTHKIDLYGLPAICSITSIRMRKFAARSPVYPRWMDS